MLNHGTKMALAAEEVRNEHLPQAAYVFPTNYEFFR
jgi:hypothetical protein